MRVDGFDPYITVDAPGGQALYGSYDGLGRVEPLTYPGAQLDFGGRGKFLCKNCLLCRSLCCIVPCGSIELLFYYPVFPLVENYFVQIIVEVAGVSIFARAGDRLPNGPNVNVTDRNLRNISGI